MYASTLNWIGTISNAPNQLSLALAIAEILQRLLLCYVRII